MSFRIEQPKYVGHWQIGGSSGLGVYTTKRPKWLTRALVAWLLEWQWYDGPK